MSDIKVSAMTYLASVPNDAKIYIVVVGDTTPYYTTKADLLAGISSGVMSLSGATVDNTDPANPIINVPTFQEVTAAGYTSDKDVEVNTLMMPFQTSETLPDAGKVRMIFESNKVVFLFPDGRKGEMWLDGRISDGTIQLGLPKVTGQARVQKSRNQIATGTYAIDNIDTDKIIECSGNHNITFTNASLSVLRDFEIYNPSTNSGTVTLSFTGCSIVGVSSSPYTLAPGFIYRLYHASSTVYYLLASPESTVNYITAAERTKLSYITISTAVNLNDINTRVNDLDAAVILKGIWNQATGVFPGAGVAQAGWSYLVTGATTTVDGVEFTNGDRIICVVDNASTTTYAGNWYKADYTDRVNTVAGRTGNVVITSSDLSDFNSAVNALITSSLASFKTTNFLDFTSSGQTQLDSKQAKAVQIKLSSTYTLTNQTALQKLFNTGGGASNDGSFDVIAGEKYEFETQFSLTSLSATSSNMQFGLIGTASLTAVEYVAFGSKNTITGNSTPNFNKFTVATASVISSSTGFTSGFARVKGTFTASTSGTVYLSYGMSVGSAAIVDATSNATLKKIS